MKKIVWTSALLSLVLALTAFVPGRTLADSAGRYDPGSEGIVSSYYHIDAEAGFITGIAPGTTAEQLLQVCLPEDTVSQSNTLATGTTISSASAQKELKVIVTADLNGSGDVSISDLLMLKSAILGESLTDTAKAAADVNYDGNVSITDFLRIKSYILNIEGIYAGWPKEVTAKDELMLIEPSASQKWNCAIPEAVQYATDSEEIAKVDDSGNITAGIWEASTFVYALDDTGAVVDRVMVAVNASKVTPSLNVSQCNLQPEQQLQLSVNFNHPVNPAVTWESSDPTVATVENGLITAIKTGKATITASLENGSKAQVEVTIAPPITQMSIERVQYKVKPGNTKDILLLTEPADSGEEFTWTSSDESIATVSDTGVVTGVDYGTVTITVTGKFSGLKATCKVKVCNVKQVAITFDDGPSVYTETLLNYLKKSDIRATFFLVGNRIGYYESYVKRQVAEGHEMGYHSYSHQMQTSLSSDQITSDFNKSNNYLKSLTGAEFTVWRTPGGDFNSRVLNCVPVPHIFWSVDTLDWQSRNTTAVYNAIVNNAYDGAIILLHDLYSTSVNGAIQAMEVLNAGDFEFLTVTELLSRDGTPPQPHKNYYNG